ncbi:manganese-binding transcriptional regulator MntR [Paracoccus jiaweipingae]|uniref:manganese-binding transcriptional regulator MntR n=1 Tax=unclassified Paracoccus (in: a-proteobacteria) TaxID=2688777 RepID=UPI0037AFDBD6
MLHDPPDRPGTGAAHDAPQPGPQGPGPTGVAPPDPDQRARNFSRLRDAHRQETAEDYVEMIAELLACQGEARIGHLAQCFGVSNATVTNTVQRLVRDGLVESRPYQPLALTPRGADLAAQSRRRHLIVRDFLIALGVDPAIAEADTEGLEHHVSPETLSAFQRFLDNR